MSSSGNGGFFSERHYGRSIVRAAITPPVRTTGSSDATTIEPTRSILRRAGFPPKDNFSHFDPSGARWSTHSADGCSLSAILSRRGGARWRSAVPGRQSHSAEEEGSGSLRHSSLEGHRAFKTIADGFRRGRHFRPRLARPSFQNDPSIIRRLFLFSS